MDLEKNLDVKKITTELLLILESRLPPEIDHFNTGNLTYDVMADILKNMFAKVTNDLKMTKQYQKLDQRSYNDLCMKGTKDILRKHSEHVFNLYKSNVMAHQQEEVHQACLEMGRFLIDHIPELIDGYDNRSLA